MIEIRYFRWRTAIRSPIWFIDRHWYVLLGQLHLLDVAAAARRTSS